MTKLIFLNAKINKVTEVNKMKNEYRNIADVKIEKIVTSINIIVNDEENAVNKKTMRLMIIERNEHAKQT